MLARPTEMGSRIGPAPGLFRLVRILARHGFIRALRARAQWPEAAHVRLALEELGVVFLKFGQVLAIRRDLLPPEYIAELEKLHDDLPTMEFTQIRDIVERELGASLEALFATFSEEPLASATIAQVHRARLLDGREVVVKVRRPGLERAVARDTTTLTSLAGVAQRIAPRLAAFDPAGLVREFRESLTREMDLALEARTITRFRAALKDFPGVWIPDVVPERSTGAVLTIEHSPGERIDRYAEAHPEARRALAAAVATLVLHQIFENGLFHADPHPGNLFVLPDGRLCLHDFGNVGELDERTRERLVAVLEATVRGDPRDVTDGYFDLGLVGSDVDREALEQEIARLLRKIRERPLAEVSVGDALQSLLREGSAHRVRNPAVLLLLGRAFVLAEGVMRELDPEVNVVAAFEQELQRVAKGRLSVSRLVQGSRRFAHELERVLQEAPADVRRALRRMATGDLGTVRSPVMESAGIRASRDLERLVRATGSGALVIAGALLAAIGGWHRVVGDGFLAIGGTGILTVILGAWYAGWKRRPRQ